MADYKPVSRTVSAADAERSRREWQEKDRQETQYAADQLRRAKQQMGEPYYNPSLAGAIVQHMGPGFAPTYQPNAKHFVQTPYQGGLYGFTTDQKIDHVTDIVPIARNLYNAGTQYMNVKPEAGHVYNFSPEPRADTFAHEYRHRAGIHDEYDNRVYDAMYSQTPEEWEKAVDWYLDKLTGDAPDHQMTRERAEADLLSILRDPEIMRDEYLRREWQAAPEGQKPYPLDYKPDLTGFLFELFGSDLNSESQYVWGSNPPFEKAIAERDRRRAPPPPPQVPQIRSLSDAFRYMPR
jgi:hypothetical protein